MIPVSYTVTPLLTDRLKDIDNLHRTILLTPILPKIEQTLRWNMAIERIHATLLLTGTKIAKKHIIETLTSPPKRPDSNQVAIRSLKIAYDTIRNEWSGNPKPIREETIEEFALLLFPKDQNRVVKAVNAKHRDIRQVLSYLEVTPEHPVIRAATLHFGLVSDPVISWGGGILGRTVCSLVLAKHGYDLHGMLGVEPVFAADPDIYVKSLDLARRQPTITSWLEYFATCMARAARLTAESIEKYTSEQTKSVAQVQEERLFTLNSRQLGILSLLENPVSTVTNRAVAKRFQVSQITASRDLSRLVALGLLYPHGKGRSVYYTKA